jgi:hypothetical protein
MIPAQLSHPQLMKEVRTVPIVIADLPTRAEPI